MLLHEIDMRDLWEEEQTGFLESVYEYNYSHLVRTILEESSEITYTTPNDLTRLQCECRFQSRSVR